MKVIRVRTQESLDLDIRNIEIIGTLHVTPENIDKLECIHGVSDNKVNVNMYTIEFQYCTVNNIGCMLTVATIRDSKCDVLKSTVYIDDAIDAEENKKKEFIQFLCLYMNNLVDIIR